MPYPEQKEFHFSGAEAFSTTKIIRSEVSEVKVIRHSRILAAFFLFGLLFHPVTASAQFQTGPEVGFNNSVIEKGVPADWTLQAHKGKAEIQPVNDNGTRVLYMRSVSSAFTLLLYTVLAIREFSFFDWAWKVWFPALRSDIREMATGDRALMVYSL